ncbi:hypothetical protein NQ315_006281 [Exocentrus adspersus]|uniref:C2H2-type domain-containing protein n=1 Tax=Exocentrus adspersus TaxID=1586481 RepID=A0AAV8W0K0_9CUCU|nr:hypothetical protein NQ315_006281 [Exocentrus adspersus]
MDEKRYPNTNYVSYQQSQYLKQATNDTQAFYPYSNYATLPSNANFLDVYNVSTSSTPIYNFQQNNQAGQQERPDLLVWESRIPEVEKTTRTKDSSPASYSDLNMLLGDTSFKPNPCMNSDQQTECSNEESDIVVEESEDDVTDNSEDHAKGLSPVDTNKCLICNVTYNLQGAQFYFLTTDTPLTMSSQLPVMETVKGIVGEVSSATNYLCGDCLALVNNVDRLQSQLDRLKASLTAKFKSTCRENKVWYRKKTFCKRKRICLDKLPKYKCKLCKKVLCLKNYCLYHVKLHQKQGNLCDVCGNVYRDKKKFLYHCKRHIKRKSNKKIDSFSCANCDKAFRTKSNKTEHENYCLGVLPFECKHCSKRFPSSTKLKNHIKHKHDKKFAVICSICNIGFVKVSDYKSHMVSHSADKKYQCPKCDKTYKTLSNLNFHMKIHNSRLPFNCHVCSKGFMRKEYLEAHINNHNGVKNFNCGQCDKKFVSQKNLDAHSKYHEGTVKRNTCNVCGKTMTTGFEEHLRIHNNLREFECKRCLIRFNTKGALSKHLKKKHL